MSPSSNLRLVDEFDLQLDEVRVSFAEGKFGAFDDFASKLPPFSHGVSFLLGRNGTGKSQFLSALAALSEGRTGRFSRASMVLRLPDEQQQLDYKHFVERFGVSDEWRHIRSEIEDDQVAYNDWYDLVHLKTHSLSSEIDPTERELKVTFRDEQTLIEVLRSLKLHQSHTDLLVDRMRGEREPKEDNIDIGDSSLTLDEIPPTPPIWNDTSCELLAKSLCLSEWQFPRHLLDSQEFRIALVDGLRELYEQGRVVITGPSMFLEKIPELGGPLERLALLLWEDLRLKPKDVIPGKPKTPSHLPLYFVGHEEADSTPPDGAAVRSWGWDLSRPTNHKDEPPNLLGELVSARLVKPFATTEDLQSLLVDQLDLRVEFKKRPREDDDEQETNSFFTIRSGKGNYTVAASLTWDGGEIFDVESASFVGLQETTAVLSNAVEILRDLDIGLHDFRMYFHELGGVPSPEFPDRLRTQKFKGAQLVVEFRAHPSSRWSHIEHLSVGQRDVVYIVLNLLLASTNASVLLNLLLFDEFGSHLHPSTITKLLSWIHKYGREHSISCIVASHDVAGLGEQSTQECPRIFALRNAFGRLELTMNPPSDVIAIAATLGTDVLRAQSVVRLHVLVEGEMDRLIVEWLTKHPRIHPLDVEVISVYGVGSFHLAWKFRMRYLTSPVLVIYDRRSDDFEQTWYREVKQNPLPYEECESLRKIERSLKERRRKDKTGKSHERSGDKELGALINLARDILTPSSDITIRTAVNRLEFCGLDVDDVLETLPIEVFKKPRAAQPPYIPAHIATWRDAHKKRSNGTSEFDKFKARQPLALIPEILQSLDASDDASLHPSLQRVRATVLGIIEPRP